MTPSEIKHQVDLFRKIFAEEEEREMKIHTSMGYKFYDKNGEALGSIRYKESQFIDENNFMEIFYGENYFLIFDLDVAIDIVKLIEGKEDQRKLVSIMPVK